MGDSQQRFFIFLAASFLFLMFWSKVFGPKPPEPLEQTQQREVLFDDAKVGAPTKTGDVGQERLDSLKRPSIPSPTVAAKPESLMPQVSKDFSFTSFSGRLTNAGGVIDRWVLAQYKKKHKGSEGVSMVPLAEPVAPPLMWTFEVSDGQETVSFADQNLMYTWVSSNQDSFVLQAELGALAYVKKEYHINPETYQVQLDTFVANRTSKPLSVSAKISLEASQDPDQKVSKGFFALFQAPKTPIRTVTMADEKVKRFDMQDIKDGDAKIDTASAITWSGFESQYFLLALRPLTALWKDIDFKVQGDDPITSARMTYVYQNRDVPASNEIAYGLNMYAGPKDIGVLKSVEPSLQHSIELGSWLGPIARLILHALRKLYDVFGNYGVAIILLTFLVRLLMFPLVQRQAKSMKAMQSHKPQMDALKQKYGDDKEGYSRALMQYMRTHKINPAGGCFPLIIQMPIFFALYRVLYNSIELRHAPFFGWIQDLSAHDPFFILPVLVGITFFLQTKFNPTPMGDPTQQAMMKFIPVVFSALMIFLPSGLNLYIFVSTLWGILQQYWVQKAKS